jgi:hypothetical protein
MLVIGKWERPAPPLVTKDGGKIPAEAYAGTV